MQEYLSITQLALYLGISESSAKRRVKLVGFPPRYKIGGRLVRWSRTEVDEWMRTHREDPHLIPAGVDPALLGGAPTGPRPRRIAA